MFSGKLDARKGTETVLRLAREMPDVPFLALVWGDDFDRAATSRQARSKR